MGLIIYSLFMMMHIYIKIIITLDVYRSFMVLFCIDFFPLFPLRDLEKPFRSFQSFTRCWLHTSYEVWCLFHVFTMLEIFVPLQVVAEEDVEMGVETLEKRTQDTYSQ